MIYRVRFCVGHEDVVATDWAPMALWDTEQVAVGYSASRRMRLGCVRLVGAVGGHQMHDGMGLKCCQLL